MSSELDRRSVLKKAAVGAAVAGTVWNAPRIDGLSIRPDYAAAASTAPCSAADLPIVVVALAAGELTPAPGGGTAAPPWVGTTVTVCIPVGATTVSIVATNNNASHGGAIGLEFDEVTTFDVTQPGGATSSGDYTSWEDNCGPGASSVPVGSSSVDVTSLFEDGAGLVCGEHTVVISQCNAFGQASVRSFDLVVS